MTQREQYTAALDKLALINESVAELGDLVDTAEPENILGAEFDTILAEFTKIQDYLTDKVGTLDQNEVVNSFLQEMKVLFLKYKASVSVSQSADGYGADYGNATPNTTITFSATSEAGVTGSKNFIKSPLTGEDL